MSILQDISTNLQIGKAKIVKTLVPQALDEGISAQDILSQGLLDGMNKVGEQFKNNEIFVPEVLIAARAMSMGTAVLKPVSYTHLVRQKLAKGNHVERAALLPHDHAHIHGKFVEHLAANTARPGICLLYTSRCV